MRKIRHLAIGLLTLACGAIAPWPAPAQDIAKDAAALVQALGDDLLEVIANNTLTSADREARFHEMLVDRTDMPTIGRFVLGRHWRTATDAQKAEFLGLFEDLVVKMFNRRVSDYRGERFAIAGARVDGDSVLVTTGITGPQRQPVKVDWRVIKADGKLKIVDMIIEGISMDVTWQQDFGAVIQRNGGQIDSLLVALRERIAQQNQSARR